ncbi:MAG TPA: hypothetical protein VFJ05_07030 [Nitrososphaeraceae archaeon]|nr:hypothetical protein [Nitrososphaeraceae archaeon]
MITRLESRKKLTGNFLRWEYAAGIADRYYYHYSSLVPNNDSLSLEDNLISCKYCDEELTFSDEYISQNGKKIPLDTDTMEPHRCEESMNAWRSSHPLVCKRCNKVKIYFDDNTRSKSGKMIPLEVNTHEPHDCPASKFYGK